VFDRQDSLFVALLRENDENCLSGVFFNFTYTFSTGESRHVARARRRES